MKKCTGENSPLSLPNHRTPAAGDGRRRGCSGAAEWHATPLCRRWAIRLHQWPLPPSPHSPIYPPPVPSHSWASSGRWAPDSTRAPLRHDRGPRSLPTICSKCVEPSVSKTGRPRFPFSLGLVSLFSGASLLPEWLLGLGSGPHQGLLEVAEPGPRLLGPSAAGLRAIHY